MKTRPRSLRVWILTATVLVNLAVAARASAAWDDDLCKDPETGKDIECCTWCILFCHCSF